MTINIYTHKRSSFFTRMLGNFCFWAIIASIFYLNHRFIGGNSFLDLFTFLSAIIMVIALIIDFGRKVITYYKVSDKKIKQIEEILNDPRKN